MLTVLGVWYMQCWGCGRCMYGTQVCPHLEEGAMHELGASSDVGYLVVVLLEQGIGQHSHQRVQRSQCTARLDTEREGEITC